MAMSKTFFLLALLALAAYFANANDEDLKAEFRPHAETINQWKKRRDRIFQKIHDEDELRVKDLINLPGFVDSRRGHIRPVAYENDEGTYFMEYASVQPELFEEDFAEELAEELTEEPTPSEKRRKFPKRGKHGKHGKHGKKGKKGKKGEKSLSDILKELDTPKKRRASSLFRKIRKAKKTQDEDLIPPGKKIPTPCPPSICKWRRNRKHKSKVEDSDEFRIPPVTCMALQCTHPHLFKNGIKKDLYPFQKKLIVEEENDEFFLRLFKRLKEKQGKQDKDGEKSEEPEKRSRGFFFKKIRKDRDAEGFRI